jgi:hypothetical protein
MGLRLKRKPLGQVYVGLVEDRYIKIPYYKDIERSIKLSPRVGNKGNVIAI